MSDIAEGIGGIAEGALLGSAVEGERTGNGVPTGKGEGACRNCGADPLGEFCQNCGQKVHVHRTLSAIGHDLIHGVLHLDGKFWNTLPLLLFKPGQLTRRYIEGERAKFVSPMAMFLFSVFAMFAVFQAVGISAPTDIRGDTPAQIREFAIAEIERLEQRQADLTADLESPDLSPDERASLESQIAETEEQLTGIRQAQEELPFFRDLTSEREVIGGVPVGRSEDGTTVVPLSVDGNTQMTIGSSDIGWLNEAIEKWRTNPGLMLYKLQTNSYKFSWLLIPLSIPFVWIMFAWKRRFKFYDHAIFVTYSIAFMSLLFIALSILTAIGVGGGWAFALLVFIPPVHIFVHLRGTYSLSIFGALIRTFLLLNMILTFVTTLFLLAMLLLGAI